MSTCERHQEPLALSPVEASRALSISRSRLYELLAEGKLRARKLGKRTVIARDDLVAYINGLPVYGGDA